MRRIVIGEKVAAALATLVILSLVVIGGVRGQAKPAEKLNWVNYTDSAEGAFSMDVPLGWQVKGGMYRFGYFDVRWMMDVRSLDGKTLIRLNDANVPPYALPGPFTGREGQAYTRPQQFQMIVSSYRDAKTYAEMYAKKRFSSVCTTMTPRTVDWSPTRPPQWQPDPGSQSDDGAVAFDCATSDGPRVVNVYVTSTLFPQSKFWTAGPVSILAAPESLGQARTMLQHMADSWKKSEQWAQYQDRVTQMGLDQIRKSFGEFMQQMQEFDRQRQAAMNQQVAGFEARQGAQARQVSGFCETLTGLETVRDPMTGNQFQIFSGPKANNYINGTGVIVNSNLSPGSDFHLTEPVRRQ